MTILVLVLTQINDLLDLEFSKTVCSYFPNTARPIKEKMPTTMTCIFLFQIDVEEATRLHREALKQSATDPLSGKIDVSILTTGQSENTRKRRFLVKTTLQGLIQKKGKIQSVNYLKAWNELKESSDVVSSFVILAVFLLKQHFYLNTK